MGADKNQLVKALVEAEKYHGPSLIIAYAPCINHGLKGGMSGAQNEIKRAVEAGYWQMYRFNPELKKEGKNLHSGLQRTYRQLQRIPAERSSLQLSAENLP